MIKKHFFWSALLLLVLTACSKKVEITGKLTNANPLERIELIEASGVATLPLVNMGVDSNGNFKGNFEAPKDGMYLISYGPNRNYIYLEKGQHLEIAGDGYSFPGQYTITGDAKANNDFLKSTQKYFENYSSKINLEDLLRKNEAAFLSEMKKIQKDLDKNIDDAADKNKASSKVVQYKKAELNTSLLTVLSQYELLHQELTGKPYTASQSMKDYVKELDNDPEYFTKTLPTYRNYQLQRLGADFQKFGEKLPEAEQAMTSTAFKKFLDTRKDLTETTKDYLLAFVITQSDMGRMSTDQTMANAKKMINEDIHTPEVKKDMEKIYLALNGLPTGESAPKLSLKDTTDNTATLPSNGKPTLIMFYASWTPLVAQTAVPVMKDVTSFFKNKLNYVYVNMDDSFAQFKSTSSSMFKGMPGLNYYADGGINSKTAEKYGIYSFRLPAYVLIDKDGKIASPTVSDLGDDKIIREMSRLTGIKVPAYQPEMPAPAPQDSAKSTQK